MQILINPCKTSLSTLMLCSFSLLNVFYMPSVGAYQNVNHSSLQSPLSVNSLPLIGQLSNSEKQWIGERIYQNECASKVENLTYWGKGEDFPSFGIGHFIWFPAGVEADFHETFPDMVRYVSQFKAPPKWLINLSAIDSPWMNKKTFDDAQSSEQLNQLRIWLSETKSYQADFIINQFLKRFSNALDVNHGARDKSYYIQLVEVLLSFKKGRFAVIDYVNFKGLGNSKEKYQGQQWGLLSVLETMNLNKDTLKQISREEVLDKFILSAKSRLKLRVRLAPKSRNEQRWLKGWFVRLDGYRLD